MSEAVLTLLILAVGFLCAFGLCEWAAARIHRAPRREPPREDY